MKNGLKHYRIRRFKKPYQKTLAHINNSKPIYSKQGKKCYGKSVKNVYKVKKQRSSSSYPECIIRKKHMKKFVKVLYEIYTNIAQMSISNCI